MAGPVQKNHGIAALVIGVLEILFGIIIMACSFAVGAKISGQSSISPYWAGIPVSRCFCELLFQGINVNISRKNQSAPALIIAFSRKPIRAEIGLAEEAYNWNRIMESTCMRIIEYGIPLGNHLEALSKPFGIV